MIPINIPPGVVFEESRVRNQSNWRETHLIRWDGNTMLPINGWEFTGITFASPCRAIYQWMTNSRLLCTAYLCELHCYADTGGELIDITPVGGLTPPGGTLAGYGDLLYSTGLYGAPRSGPSRLGSFTTAFSLDNWGDELRVMTSADGRYLKWSPATPSTPLVVVPGSPTGNSFVITPERHAMIFGLNGNADQFGWSDQENDADWNFASTTNKAGFYDIEPSAPIVARCQFFGGIMVFTTQAAYIVRHIGLPYVYSYTEIGKPPSPINAQSVIEVPQGVMWPSTDGFWLYNGNSIDVIPCPIWDFVKKYVDVPNSLYRATVISVENKDEIWFCYVDLRDGDPSRNTRVIVYEHRSHWWSMGKVSRSAGYVFSNNRNPIMADGLNLLKHEIGYDYPGEEYPWAESFSMNLSSGDHLATLHQMMPEITGDRDAVQFRVVKKNDRTRDVETMSPPRRPFNGNGLVDIRQTARDFRLRIEMTKSAAWSVGPILVDAKIRGKK